MKGRFPVKKYIGLFIILIYMLFPVKAYAMDIEMKATAYCLRGQTASGTQTRYGICASKKEWIGRTVSIYTKYNGFYLGTYVIEDTGGEAIKSGKVIDLWFPSKELCDQFGCVDVVVRFED